MLNIRGKYATDLKAEVEGVPVPLDGCILILARNGNKAYAKALQKAVEDNQATLDVKDDAADAKSDEIMIDCIARHILKGWSGVEGDVPGTELPYSLQAAKEALAFKDFRAEVLKLSDERQKFQLKKVEAKVKN